MIYERTDERRQSRRGFLAGSAAATTAAFGSGLSSTVAAANDVPPADSPAEYVDHITEVRDDVDELRAYAPKLSMVPSAREDMQGMYGWIAESDEYDVTAYYYWVRYHTQRSILYYFGLDINILDTHHKDHEPVIVFVRDDGTVDSVVYSGGHHYAAETDGRFGNLIEDRVENRRTHINLQTIRPWNHYAELPISETAVFVDSFAEFDSWLSVRDSWYRNGRYGSTSTEAIEDPFSFYDDGSGDSRTMWWKSGTPDAWFGKNIWNRLVTHDRLRYEE